MLLASRDNGSFVLIFAPESWEKRLYWHRNTLPHRLLGARCSTNMESENALKEPFKRLSNLTIGPHFVIHGALPLRRILSGTRCSLRSYPPGAGLVRFVSKKVGPFRANSQIRESFEGSLRKFLCYFIMECLARSKPLQQYIYASI